MELAKSLNAADVYVPLSRSDSTPQWEQLKKDNPYGFDVGKQLPVPHLPLWNSGINHQFSTRH
jgi:hypothetical protein